VDDYCKAAAFFERMITMRHTPIVLAGVLFVLAIAGSSASAQYMQPRPPGYGSPPVSPYLQLLRRNESTASNYFGIVRPTIDLRNSVTGLQQQETQTNAQVAATNQTLTIPETGHSVAFMNTGHYFGTGAGGLTTRGSTAATTQRSTGRTSPGR
jgi:hypothetical protein